MQVMRAELQKRGGRTYGDPPRVAVELELQLSPDVEKQYAWPQYLVGAYVRLRCPIELVVPTLDDSVAAWCRRPIARSSSLFLRPTVIGPREVPSVEDVAAARAATATQLEDVFE